MNFTAKDVAALREKTGCGMMDCKKALNECNGDMEAAVKYLREKGIAKAAAKAVKALEKAPADEKLKLAAEAAEKAAKAAAAGELIPETFEDYLNKWVYGCKDQAELLDKIGGSRLMRLKNEPHLGYSTTH